jgi:hypothetical protein
VSVPGAAEVNVLVPLSAVTMSWPVPAGRLIDVEATNLTVVVLFAAANVGGRAVEQEDIPADIHRGTVVRFRRKGHRAIGDSHGLVGFEGVFLGQATTTSFTVQRIRAALDEGRGVRETARLLKVSAAKVSEVRRMAVSATG